MGLQYVTQKHAFTIVQSKKNNITLVHVQTHGNTLTATFCFVYFVSILVVKKVRDLCYVLHGTQMYSKENNTMIL